MNSDRHCHKCIEFLSYHKLWNLQSKFHREGNEVLVNSNVMQFYKFWCNGEFSDKQVSASDYAEWRVEGFNEYYETIWL